MDRLASFDVTELGRTRGEKIAAEIVFGAMCAGTMIGLRSLVDLLAPTAGPFALIYPPILVATLYGRMLAGVVAQAISLLWVWWFILPPPMSFDLAVVPDASRLILNLFSTSFIVIFAEAFRRAMRNASRARDEEIERRSLLMKELEHRSRNNFALVGSLLALQQRRTDNAEVKAALAEAIGRIDTFAKAYENLTLNDTATALVPMRSYIANVVERVAAGAFSQGIEIAVAAEEWEMPHRTAVAIGLFINEALTNCAKYAFPDGRLGRIRVTFVAGPEGWSLEVGDNGIGGSPESAAEGPRSGMGQGLMSAFARQAEAEYRVAEAQQGRTVVLESRSG